MSKIILEKLEEAINNECYLLEEKIKDLPDEVDYSKKSMAHLIQLYSELLVNKIKNIVEQKEKNMVTVKTIENYNMAQAYAALAGKKINFPEIKDFNVLVPGRVVEVLFVDGGKEKMICHEDDKFDLRNCLFIAIAKHMFKDTYTFEGLEKKAKDISYEKHYVKIVDKALKDYAKKLKEVERNEKIIAESNAIVARKREKRIRKAQNRRERYIEAQKEAYKRALVEVEQMKGAASCE